MRSLLKVACRPRARDGRRPNGREASDHPRTTSRFRDFRLGQCREMGRRSSAARSRSGLPATIYHDPVTAISDTTACSRADDRGMTDSQKPLNGRVTVSHPHRRAKSSRAEDARPGDSRWRASPSRATPERRPHSSEVKKTFRLLAEAMSRADLPRDVDENYISLSTASRAPTSAGRDPGPRAAQAPGGWTRPEFAIMKTPDAGRRNLVRPRSGVPDARGSTDGPADRADAPRAVRRQRLP